MLGFTVYGLGELEPKSYGLYKSTKPRPASTKTCADHTPSALNLLEFRVWVQGLLGLGIRGFEYGVSSMGLLV